MLLLVAGSGLQGRPVGGGRGGKADSYGLFAPVEENDPDVDL